MVELRAPCSIISILSYLESGRRRRVIRTWCVRAHTTEGMSITVPMILIYIIVAAFTWFEQPKCPLVDKQTKWGVHTEWDNCNYQWFFSLSQKGDLESGYKVDEIWGHCVKQNQSVTQGWTVDVSVWEGTSNAHFCRDEKNCDHQSWGRRVIEELFPCLFVCLFSRIVV